MRNRKTLWACCLLLVSHSALASTPLYSNPAHHLRFNLPAGWKVRPSVSDGQQVLRVIPPKADQRERAAIEVTIQLRKVGSKETLDKLQRMYRKPDEDREAASVVKASPKSGKLVVEYREGRFVSNGLWIVRNNLNVFVWLPKHRLVEAKCAANASEFKTYRRQLEAICLSAAYLDNQGLQH